MSDHLKDRYCVKCHQLCDWILIGDILSPIGRSRSKLFDPICPICLTTPTEWVETVASTAQMFTAKSLYIENAALRERLKKYEQSG